MPDPTVLTAAIAAWGLASAFAVAGLGAASLLGKSSRPWGAWPFGLFAIAFGAQIASVNLALLPAARPWAGTLFLGHLAALLATTYFLVEFARSQAPRAATRAWKAARAAGFALPLGAALVLTAAPSLLYRGTVPFGGGVAPSWGPLYAPLAVVPFYGAFAVALVALTAAKREAPTPRVADRAALFVAGLGLFVGFTAGYYLGYYGGWLTLYPGASEAPYALGVYAPLFVALTAVAGAVGVLALRDARRGGDSREARRDRLVGLAVLAPMAWGVVEGLLALTGAMAQLHTVGLWRLAGVAVIAYGLARWRVYDLPARARRAAARSVGLAGAVSGGVAAYGTSALILPAAGLLPALLGLVTLSVAAVPSMRLARGLLGEGAAPHGEQETLYGQRVEAYRAAVEASLARGTLADDAAFLEALRARFGLSEDEARVLRHLAKSAVLLPREGDAGAAFERLRLLGEGGGGRTWLARDRARDRLVVVKEPVARWHREPEVREAVLREARTAARVRHPNVVEIEEVGEQGGVPVLVMEYVEGGSLADLLAAKGPLDPADAVPLILEVLRGVEAVHAGGVLHRDLKPSNILLTAEGRPKIADFGIAVAAGSGTTAHEAAGAAGTLSYMPPEAREGRWDRRSDVYACGAVLHECLFGAPPAPGAPLPALPPLPEALRAALARALSTDPAQRFATARAFAEALPRPRRA